MNNTICQESWLEPLQTFPPIQLHFPRGPALSMYNWDIKTFTKLGGGTEESQWKLLHDFNVSRWLKAALRLLNIWTIMNQFVVHFPPNIWKVCGSWISMNHEPQFCWFLPFSSRNTYVKVWDPIMKIYIEWIVASVRTLHTMAEYGFCYMRTYVEQLIFLQDWNNAQNSCPPTSVEF